MPPSGKKFIPNTSTLAYLIAFLISTFQLQQFPRYQGVPNLHQGGLHILDAPQRRNVCTVSEYFTISNCVFNFSFLSLVVYEILGRSQIHFRGCCAPWMPSSGKFFILKTSTLAYLIAFLISTFQLQQFARYQGVPNLHQGAYAPLTPPSGEIFVRKASTSQCLIVFLISAFYLQYFTRYQGGPTFILGGAALPWMPPSGKCFIAKTSTLAYLIAFLISTFQLQQFQRYQGVPNLHQGALRTLDAPQRRNFCTQCKYFTISNCVFNFSFLSLVVRVIKSILAHLIT